MATYTVSQFAIDTKFPIKLNPPGTFVVACGTITINPYSQTRLAITQITNLLKPSTALIRVIIGPYDAAFANIGVWDATNNSIWVAATSAPQTQVAEGLTTIGQFQWFLMGQGG